MDFIFIAKNEPTEELIMQFHDGLAKDLIENLGVETIREVIRQYRLRNQDDKKAE